MNDDPVERLALLGASDEACALAERAALAGYEIRLYDPNPAALARARRHLRALAEEGVAEGRLTPRDRQHILDRIFAVGDLDEAVRHAVLVLALPIPIAEAQRILFDQLGESCRASTLIALCGGGPLEIPRGFPQPGRVLGLHLIRDPAGSPLSAEVLATPHTAAHALERALHFTERLGHAPPRRA